MSADLDSPSFDAPSQGDSSNKLEEKARSLYVSMIEDGAERTGSTTASTPTLENDQVIRYRAKYGNVATSALEATKPEGAIIQVTTASTADQVAPFRPVHTAGNQSGPFRPAAPNEPAVQPFRPAQSGEPQPFRPGASSGEPTVRPFTPPVTTEPPVQPFRPSNQNQPGVAPFRPSNSPEQPAVSPFRPSGTPSNPSEQAPVRSEPAPPVFNSDRNKPAVQPFRPSKGGDTIFQPRPEMRENPVRPVDPNGVIQDRAPYNGVAPGARDATSPDNQFVQPNAPGTVPGDGDCWRPSPNQLPTNLRPIGSGGNSFDYASLVSPEGRARVEKDLHQHLSTPGYLSMAAIGGVLGSGPVPWTLDKLASKTGVVSAVDTVSKWEPGGWKVGRALTLPARYYMEGHSPLGMQITAERLNAVEASRIRTESISQRQNLLAEYRKSPLGPELRNNARALQASITDTTNILDTAKDLPESAKHAYGDKIRFLQEAQTGGAKIPADLRPYIMDGKSAHPLGRQFLTQAEADLLNQRRTMSVQRAEILSKLDDFKTKISTAEGTIASVEKNVAALKSGGSKFPFWGTVKPTELPELQTAGSVKLNMAADGSLRATLPPAGTAITKALPWETRLPPGSNFFKRLGGEWRGNSWSNKIGEGLAIGSLVLATDAFFDKHTTGKDHQTYNKDYFLGGPALAAGLILPKNPWAKVGTAGTLYIGSKLANFLPGPAPSPEYSMVMKPNNYEALATGIAWMMPFKALKNRGIALGTAWALGRGANLVNEGLESMGWGIPGLEPGLPGMGNGDRKARLNETLKETVVADGTNLNHESFDAIVRRGKSLGMETEGALIIQLADFMGAHKNDADPLYRLHGGAALNTATGDYWMERGTKIDLRAHNADGRILVDSKADLGGQALFFYRAAAGSLIEAENHLRKNGDAAKADEMLKSRQYVEKQIDGIYGPHDIDKIYAELKDKTSVDWSRAGKILTGNDDKYSAGGIQQNMSLYNDFQPKLKAQVDNLRTSDKRYHAKMCRDLALLSLAIADVKAEKKEGGGAKIMYMDAMRYLDAAEKLDGSAPDTPKVRQISDKLKDKVVKAVGSQFDSTVNNPLRVQQ